MWRLGVLLMLLLSTVDLKRSVTASYHANFLQLSEKQGTPTAHDEDDNILGVLDKVRNRADYWSTKVNNDMRKGQDRMLSNAHGFFYGLFDKIQDVLTAPWKAFRTTNAETGHALHDTISLPR